MKKLLSICLGLLLACSATGCGLFDDINSDDPNEPTQHVCNHVCPTCKKCTDLTCGDDVCKEKCYGMHDPAEPSEPSEPSEPTTGTKTVAEMITIMKDWKDNQISETEYTVTGVVKSVKYSEQYKNYEIYLEAGDDAFELYACLLGNCSEPKAGDTVTCKGYAQKFVGTKGTTYELTRTNSSNPTLISVVPGQGEQPVTPVLPEGCKTVAEMIEIMKDYADKQVSEVEYTVGGVVTKVTYNADHNSYTLDLQSTGAKFQIYSAQLGTGVTAPTEGATVVCTGYAKKFGDTYEIAYISEKQASPVISSVTGGQGEQPVTPVTPEETKTVAEMITIMKDWEAGKISEVEYTVTGVVKSIKYSEKYKNYEIYLEAGDDAFELYACLLGNCSEPKAGDTVTCKGYAQKYVKDESVTYELTRNNDSNPTLISVVPGQGEQPVVTEDVGSKTEPLTLAEAIAKFTEPGAVLTGKDFYIKGIITSVKDYSGEGKTNCYTIWVADENDANAEFEIYKGSCDSGVDTAKLIVGNEICFHGAVTLFNNKTWENGEGAGHVFAINEKEYAVKVNADEHVTVLTQFEKSYKVGTQVTIEIELDQNYIIKNATVNGNTVKFVENTATFVMGNGADIVIETKEFEELIEEGQTKNVTLELSREFDFYGSEWTNSYTTHNVSFEDLGENNFIGSVDFTAANKQATDQIIHDMPVLTGKNGSYVTISVDGYAIKEVTFNLKEWNEKKKFASIYVEESINGTDWTKVAGVGFEGTSNATTISSINSKVTATLGDGVVAVRLYVYATGTSNVQVGAESIDLVLSNLD